MAKIYFGYLKTKSMQFIECNVGSVIFYSPAVKVGLCENVPHLLDEEGDSCHHLHDVAKALCSPFDYYIETFR